MKIPSITVTQVARKCNRTPGRIRQICNQNDIGTLVGGRVRVLTDKEVEKILKILSADGRKKVESTVDE